MALMEGTRPQLGAAAPDFLLPAPLSGGEISRDNAAKSRGLLVIFMCNHCPYVQCIMDSLTAFGDDYRDKEIGMCAISANDPANYPADAPEKMAALAKAQKFSFPYLFDGTQSTARAYGAQCTPDLFLYGRNVQGGLALAYAGQFDAARPGSPVPAALAGRDLRDAMDRVLSGKDPLPESEQKPSIGCSIKWR